MNKDDFWVGAIAGAIVGMLFFAGLSIYLRDRGRDECDIKLPRTENVCRCGCQKQGANHD